MRRDQSEWYRQGYTQDWFDGLTRGEREVWLSKLSNEQIEAYFRDWRVWAHDYQIPPETDWDTWLSICGRGAGKTRGAVEYITDCVEQGWPQRIAIVGQGEDDIRNVMVMGRSGFLACAPSWNKPTFRPSVGGGMVIWPNGCTAFIYSAVDTEGLRGPEFHLGWFDEPMALPRAQRERALDNLELCLRIGDHPQLLLTTTPKKDAWLRKMELMAKNPDNKIHFTRASTDQNAKNLAPNYLRKVHRLFDGTRQGKQELEGLILGDEDGALWTEENLDETRWANRDPYDVIGECDKITVSIDPNTRDANGKALKTAHAAGIIVCGRIGRERVVLADRTVSGGPSKWGRAAVEAAIDFDADEFHGESNQGGEMVRIVIQQAIAEWNSDPDHHDRQCPTLPVHLSFSKKSKEGRAEPVSTMYERKLIHHVGPKKDYELLEMQMCYLHEGQGQDPTKEDFDRCDALVWGMTRLGVKANRKISASGGGFGIVTMGQNSNAQAY